VTTVIDLYETLGLERWATADEIERAYRALEGELHVQAGSDPIANARYRQVRYAYETLSSPSRRAEYDASLGDRLPPEAASAAPHKHEHHSRNPVDRMTRRLPQPWRVGIDWVVTIVGAIAIVLAIKAWVINPYRIPSSSMEPRLHCAQPGSGCIASYSDRVLANRFLLHFRDPRRGEIVVFDTPPAAAQRCGAGGTFVKRIVGLPGDLWEERDGFVFINGKKLEEPYLDPTRRDGQTYPGRMIPAGQYFMMGDNRSQSCDSRIWGPVPRENLIGVVFATYWPPNRLALY
jgi:signal peptidase I